MVQGKVSQADERFGGCRLNLCVEILEVLVGSLELVQGSLGRDLASSTCPRPSAP